MTSSRSEDPRTSAWSWTRLLRIGALTLLLLGALDHLLLPSVESQLLAHADEGGLRNRHGSGIADACRQMLLEGNAHAVGRGIVFAGSSVTFGAGLDPREAMPAQLHHELEVAHEARPVFNCAAAGGSPSTAIPIVAALGHTGAELLLVEILSPSYIEGRSGGREEFSDDEVALLLGASTAQRGILESHGLFPRRATRIESALDSFVRRSWRLYRLRGSLWIDDTLMPNLLIWTLRREAAVAGILPKRFHGQTTNVGKLPWREAYVGGQRPAANQRFQAPSDGVSEDAFESLRITRELAAAVNTPVLFYDVPLNLAFQRHFELMTEEQIERLERSRALLVERMAAEGMHVVPAPVFSDDDFLDKAHMTPSGAEKMARHLLPNVVRALRDDPGAALAPARE